MSLKGKVLWGKWRVQQLKKWRFLVKRKGCFYEYMFRVQCQISAGSCCCTERFLDCPRNALLKEAENSHSDFIIWPCLSWCMEMEVWCVTISLESNRNVRGVMDQTWKLPSFSSPGLSCQHSLTPCFSWSFCFPSHLLNRGSASQMSTPKSDVERSSMEAPMPVPWSHLEHASQIWHNRKNWFTGQPTPTTDMQSPCAYAERTVKDPSHWNAQLCHLRILRKGNKQLNVNLPSVGLPEHNITR